MTEEKKNEILEFLQRARAVGAIDAVSSGEPFSIPFELKPEDFMRFAIRDLKDTTEERSLVNALSNIKRAIDCRTASLLCFFGVYDKSKKEDWNFPQSTDFLLKVGVLAPNILRKINKKRNELEHDFKKPIHEEVTDFLDIAQLFFAFTDQLLKNKYKMFVASLITKEGKTDFRIRGRIEIRIDSQKGFIELELIKSNLFGVSALSPVMKGDVESTKIEIPASDENYTKILSQLVETIINR